MRTSNDMCDPIRRLLLAATLFVPGLAFTGAAHSQDYETQQWEWEADEGLHEEEWYDPSDWFDDEFGPYEDDYYSTIDFETDADWWDGWYDDTYDDAWWADDNDWYVTDYWEGPLEDDNWWDDEYEYGGYEYEYEFETDDDWF